MFRTKASQVAALGLAAVLLISACGRDEESGGGSSESGGTLGSGPATGTITMWAQGAEAEALPAMLETFEASNPGITVNVTAIPWDAAHNKYQTAIAGGNTPDVAQMGTTWMGDFSDAFDPTPSQIDTSVFFPGSLGSTEVNGTSFGVPWYVDTRVIYYRSDLAAEAGYDTFPTNWDDFKAMAQALQTEAGAAFGVQLPTGVADSFQSMLPFPWSNGAELLNEDGDWTLDTPEMVEALTYYQSFFTEGIADENPTLGAGAAESAFVDGTAPMMIAGPANIGALEQAGGEGFADQYAVATIPKQTTGTSFVGGSDLVVFKDSENRDAAWRLVEWLSQPEVQIELYAAIGDLPAVQSAWDDPSLSADPKLAVFGEQLEDTKAPPSLSTWTQVAAAGDRQLERIVKSGADPAEAMKDLQAEADEIGTGN
jgi:multiple sugar transport system substrate-binding protein